MKKMSRILSVILAICMVVSLMPSVWAVENADTVEILLLDTSDIHGQLYATNYTNDYAQSGTNNQGLTRVATYIKEMRAQYENLYLADTGDTIQGTPLTYYFAFEEDTMPDPTVKAMRTLGYDMWVLGNHEFNYGMKILTEQVDYAISEATEGETPITMSMANYLAAETNSDESKDWATWRGFEPYVIKEYDGVKVAIMGIGNPGVPQWDVPANWEGIYFANPIETYDHYEAEMLEKADMIVLASPIYFWHITAQTKAVIDRMYALYVAGRFKAKKTAGIFVSGGDLDCSDEAVSFYNNVIIKKLHWEDCGVLRVARTGRDDYDLEAYKQKALYSG